MVEKFSDDGTKKVHVGNSRKSFDIHMPERWLKHAYEGGSVPEFCRKEMMAKSTFYDYCDNYPTMMAARKMGKDIAEGWWMEQARLHLITYSSKEAGSTKFNDKIYTWTMAGRFGQSVDKDQRAILDELMRRTAHLAEAPSNAIAEEAEFEMVPNEEA